MYYILCVQYIKRVHQVREMMEVEKWAMGRVEVEGTGCKVCRKKTHIEMLHSYSTQQHTAHNTQHTYAQDMKQKQQHLGEQNQQPTANIIVHSV